jgi:hypothetical protein
VIGVNVEGERGAEQFQEAVAKSSSRIMIVNRELRVIAFVQLHS